MNNIKIAKELIKLAKDLIEESVLSDENISYELNKIKINQYQPFNEIHEHEWMAFPKNRNVNLPDIYVFLDGEKIKCGYNYIDENKEDYQGTAQTSIIGLLQELSILIDKVNTIAINIRNEQLDKIQEEESKENTEEKNTEEEIPDENSKEEDINF